MVGIVANSFNPPSSQLINITLGDYLCNNTTLYNSQQIRCTVPTTVQQFDYGRLLPVTLTTSDGTSSPYTGVQVWALLTVQSVSGCSSDARNGSAAWKAVGCSAGSTVTVQGSGFDAAYGGVTAYVWLGTVTYPQPQTMCANVSVLSNSTLTCVLPIYLTPNQWVPISVQIGAQAIGYDLLQYGTPQPNITGVSGQLHHDTSNGLLPYRREPLCA